MAWSTWRPWPDVRIDTVCVAVDGTWHLRLHRVHTTRALHSIESGFALGFTPVLGKPDPASVEASARAAAFRTEHGTSAIVELGGGREPAVLPLAPNANLMQASHCGSGPFPEPRSRRSSPRVCGVRKPG